MCNIQHLVGDDSAIRAVKRWLVVVENTFKHCEERLAWDIEVEEYVNHPCRRSEAFQILQGVPLEERDEVVDREGEL